MVNCVATVSIIVSDIKKAFEFVSTNFMARTFWGLHVYGGVVVCVCLCVGGIVGSKPQLINVNSAECAILYPYQESCMQNSELAPLLFLTDRVLPQERPSNAE